MAPGLSFPETNSSHDTYRPSQRQTRANGSEACDIQLWRDHQRQKELYYRYVVPESKLLIRDLLSRKAKVNCLYVLVPLLVISGSLDQVSPPSQNYLNYQKYVSADASAAYKEFKGFNHLIFGDPQWMEIADHILAWLIARG